MTKWGAYTPEKTVNYENLVKVLYNVRCMRICNDDGNGVLQSRNLQVKKKAEQMHSGEIRPTNPYNLLKCPGENASPIHCNLACKDDRF